MGSGNRGDDHSPVSVWSVFLASVTFATGTALLLAAAAASDPTVTVLMFLGAIAGYMSTFIHLLGKS